MAKEDEWSAMAQLEFFFDVICPEAWLAARHLENTARRASIRLVARPVSLDGIYHAINSRPLPADQWPAAKQKMAARDLLRRAELLDLPMRPPSRTPENSDPAMRLLAVAPETARWPLMLAVFEACWARSRPPDDRTLLMELAEEHGLDPALMDRERTREILLQNTEEAVERGAFGVPTVMLDEQIWWGADRLGFLDMALGLTPLDPKPDSVAPSPERPRLTMFHDFSSPFSYLGSTRVEQLARDHDAELTFRPMLLGGLFREIGTPMIPLHAMSEERRDWARRDLHNWADHYGVPFRFNSHFPLNTILALRVAHAEPGLTPALYRAVWVDNRDLSQADVVSDVIRQAGYDPAPLLEQAGSQPAKDAIRHNTEAAGELGVCGAPSFLVNDRLLFWGQDRLDQVALALNGWIPAVDRTDGQDGGAL